MCIIAVIDPIEKMKFEVPKKTIRICWNNNPDGCGYSYVDGINKNVVIKKGFTRWKKFWKSYTRDRCENINSSFVVHFRVASRGEKSIGNCHPIFVFENKVAIAHNGTITNIPATVGTGKSDTVLFIEQFLSQLGDDFYKNKGTNILLTEFIGNSRIAVMDNDNVYLYNYDAWIKDFEGYVMFSNKSYLEIKKTIGTYVDNNESVVYRPPIYEPRQQKYVPKCSCGLKMYDPPEALVGACFKCMNQEQKNNVLAAYPVVECSACKTKISPVDDWYDYVSGVCSTCWNNRHGLEYNPKSVVETLCRHCKQVLIGDEINEGICINCCASGL